MAINRTAAILVSSLVMGHLGYYVLKPIFIPEATNKRQEPVAAKPIYWEKPPEQSS